MNKQEIKSSKQWEYISSLTPGQRCLALFGSEKSAIEKFFGVAIEERPYSALSSVKDEMIAISIYRDGAFSLAVLMPNKEQNPQASVATEVK